MRVIAGEARGFPLKGPPGSSTRATSDKVRGAIFDALVLHLADARVLDLYSGTGALGIEALSRGAASCLFVEKAAAACRVIGANLRTTKLDGRAYVWCTPVETALTRLEYPSPPTLHKPATAVAWHTTDTAVAEEPGEPATAVAWQTMDTAVLGENTRPQSASSAMRPQSQAASRRGVRAPLPSTFSPPYDLIVLDPPYDDPRIADVVEHVSRPGLLAQGGLVVLEHGKRWPPPASPGGLHLRRTRLYGDTGVTLWQRGEEE